MHSNVGGDRDLPVPFRLLEIVSGARKPAAIPRRYPLLTDITTMMKFDRDASDLVVGDTGCYVLGCLKNRIERVTGLTFPAHEYSVWVSQSENASCREDFVGK